MTLIKHEWKQGRAAFLIWTGSIGLLLGFCIFLFPEMKGQMEDVSALFASMGSFTAAFGMDRLNISSLTGFYAVECGSVLGLGGAFFASLTAAGLLSKEERGKTAEFLLAHPLSRTKIVTAKFLSLLSQIAAMNLALLGLAAASMLLIGEEIPVKELLLLHLAYFLMQLELAGICFGLSAFLQRSGAGIALGLAAMTYFLNLISNITESAHFLRPFTPFAYCEGADIVEKGGLNLPLVFWGLLWGAVGIAAAYAHYCRKDIAV